MGKSTQELNNIITKEFLIEEYCNKNKNLIDIAKEIGCSGVTVGKYRKKWGIPLHKVKSPETLELDKILTYDFLFQKYINEKTPTTEIAKEVGSNFLYILNRLRELNIPVRSISEANIGKKKPKPVGFGIAIGKKLKNRKYSAITLEKMRNVKRTAEHKRKISEALKGDKHFNWKGGISPLVKRITNSKEYDIWWFGVVRRDNYTCTKCASKKELEVHHIKKFSILFKEFTQLYFQFDPLKDKEILLVLALKHAPFWDINNGKTICLDCHYLIHGSKRKK